MQGITATKLEVDVDKTGPEAARAVSGVVKDSCREERSLWSGVVVHSPPEFEHSTKRGSPVPCWG